MTKLLAISSLIVLMSTGVMAHHGSNSQFDTSKIIKVSGVVTDLGFVNPHSYVYFDVTDENGNVENWHCEMRASSVLKRSGWTEEMFAKGTRIDIVGVASRKEANGCYVETIALNNEPAIKRYAQIEENKLEPDTDRPLTTSWGEPYIAGDWAAAQRLIGAVSGPNVAGGMGGGMGPPGMGMGRGGSVPLSEAGVAAAAAIAKAGEEGFSGRLDCNPRDFFSDWTFDQPANRIIQEQDKIILKYGFMDTVRTIHMDMSSHPSDITPSWAGHSIGHWDDDVLVVDTIGFTVSSGRRGTHSEQFHAVERFSLVNKGELKRAYEADDALFWKAGQKQTGEDTVYLSDYPYEPYACDDRTIE